MYKQVIVGQGFYRSYLHKYTFGATYTQVYKPNTSVSAVCPEGEGYDNGACTACPVGSYSDAADLSACTTCDAGYSTLSASSTASTDCIGKHIL